MVVISTKWHQPWLRQQCVPFHLLNMIFLTGNLCYIIVPNVQVLSYPVNNKTGMTQTHFQQKSLTSTEYYYTVLCMTDFHKKKNSM